MYRTKLHEQPRRNATDAEWWNEDLLLTTEHRRLLEKGEECDSILILAAMILLRKRFSPSGFGERTKQRHLWITATRQCNDFAFSRTW